MDFGNPWSLFSGLLISCVGMGYFLYGKKAQKLWPLLAGLALGIYPYFISSVWLMWALALGIMGGVYMLREQ
jgi:hypothetical protein